jgi:hypothetical protein
MKKILLAACMFVLPVTGVGAVDLSDLQPCKPAAQKYCDRSGGMNFTNLLRCGATLASLSDQVGQQCRQVLRRYGQLQ